MASDSRASPTGTPDEPQLPGSFLASLPQFFVFPLILVATLSAVYLVLRLLAGTETASAQDLLSELRSAGDHSRWQVAQQLADGLGRGSLSLDDVSADDLAGLYREFGSGEGGMKRFLLGILAFKGDAVLTGPMVEALGDEDGAVREAALAALARAGDPQAAPALAAHLDHPVREERWLAMGALANLGTPAALDAVALRLGGDDVLEHRNAVLALAACGDGRATAWLGELLKRDAYPGDPAWVGDRYPDPVSAQAARDGLVEQFLVNSCRAAAALADPAFVPLLQKLREGDPSLKVRSAAINAIHDLQTQPERP